MNAEPRSLAEREQRLHQAVAAYLEAAEAGPVHPDQALRQYPEFASELAEFFSGRDQLDGLAAPLREIAAWTAARQQGPPRQLGDYRILREVGRGGMGVVFEAVQESLNRHVALKVLPTSALLAPEHLARFRREAQAAALLHHSNIVPVFGVGQDRGVYFYAMQFIHGQSLDGVLRELRRLRAANAAAAPGAQTPVPEQLDPGTDSACLVEGLRTGQFQKRVVRGPWSAAGEEGTPSTDFCFSVESPDSDPSTGAHAGGDTPLPGLTGRSEGEFFRGVARIGVQVAEALAYAHRQGILHRDIKPANLLLDAQGTVWVTDFGLAKAEGGDELTRSGNVVGTLRYLAPERFDGRSDPRSDVYSLGATLFELLTLRPAFDEPDRPRLIERITRGDPGHPRQIDGCIPRDLETIVLKALARDQADRYPSAQALAEDLRRFLLDRPIQARRAGLAERTWRWCRRNPVVAGLLTTAVVLAAGLAVLALMLWDRQKQTEAALRQAEQQRQAAEARRLVVEANFLLPLMHQLEWLNDRGPSKARQEALENARTLYQSFLHEAGADAAQRMLRTRVYMELGQVQMWLGQSEESARSYRQAAALLEQLVAEFPRESGFRNFLGECYKKVGLLHKNPARPQEAEQAYRQALSVFEGLRQEFPAVAWYRREVGLCWFLLGEHRRMGGRFQQAEEAHRQALAQRQQLFNQSPVGEQKQWLAESHGQLAWLLATRPDRQPRHATEALEHARKAVELQPDFHDRWHTLGVAHCRMGHWKEALVAIKKSRQLQGNPGPPGSFDRFFEAMAYSGLGDREKARRCYDEGVQWMEKHLPDHADLRRFRAEAAEMLGIKHQPPAKEKEKPPAKAPRR